MLKLVSQIFTCLVGFTSIPILIRKEAKKVSLAESYNQINKLLSETQNLRTLFVHAKQRVEQLETIIIPVFECFSNPFSSCGVRGTSLISIGDYNFRNFGIEGIRFSKSKHEFEYNTLKSMSENSLTDILNLYSPRELEVKKIFVNEFEAILIVSLKNLDII